MRAFLTAVALAQLVSAGVLRAHVAHSCSDELVVVDASNLPGSGQIVAQPLAFHASFDPWQDSVLSLHTQDRAKYGAGPLTWSSDLYPATLQWAQQCVFQHSGGSYGENLGAGTGSYGFPDAIASWMGESANYDYNNPGFSSNTGHFTQASDFQKDCLVCISATGPDAYVIHKVVWKSTQRVACAIASCGPGTIFAQASNFVVCRYDPAGNYEGQFADNVGRPV